MSFYIKTWQITYCAECNKPLAGPNDWALHRRQHMIERLVSTEDGRRIYGMLTQCGFSDQPDKRLTDAATKEMQETA